MNIDRKISYGTVFSLLVLLFLTILVPIEYLAIILSLILIAYAILVRILLKKRNLESVYSNQVLLIVTVSGILYLVLYYLFGIKFGFYVSPNRFSLINLFKYIIPIIAIVIAFELIRNTLLAQEKKSISFFVFVCAILVDFLLEFTSFSTFNAFMDVVGLTVLPSIMFNFLYQNVSKNYGYKPTIIFRIIITIYAYIIPFLPSTPDPLVAMFKLLIPFLILSFIRLLYEKKKKYAKESKHTKLGNIIFVCTILLMISFVMLISNQFKYGVIVIATNSMSGEINTGDVVVFKKTDEDDIISIGQIIVYQKNDSIIIHRVVDIKHIDGVLQYYTKGDANDENDDGYITKQEIIGYVNFKLPYLGYLSIELRQLFEN